MAPKEGATAYLTVNNLVNSLAAGIGPVLGGIFADFFTGRELSLILSWKSPSRELGISALNFQHWDFFFGLAFLIGIYSLRQLTKVKEVGEAGKDVVVRELITMARRPMRSLSTIAGLRQLNIFPFFSRKAE